VRPAKAYTYPPPLPSFSSSSSSSSSAEGWDWSERESQWSVLAAAPEAKAADLLLVTFDRALSLPERACFADNLAPCPKLLRPQAAAPSDSGGGSGGGVAVGSRVPPPLAPPWYLVLGASMRWGMLDKVRKVVTHEPSGGVFSGAVGHLGRAAFDVFRGP